MKKNCLTICLMLLSVFAFSQYTKLFDFDSINGSAPHGDLYSDGTYLYGMTLGGGIYHNGVVFKIKPDGSEYSKLLDFDGTTNGKQPYGSLISDGTYLYGMTYNGGTNDQGIIFKIKPNGTQYVKLHEFAITINGRYPYGTLFYDGTFLYGMTQGGGSNDQGTIFKIKPDGSLFTKLYDFIGTTNGAYPYGTFISDGTYLFGMTKHGGTNDMGVVFKIKPNGSEYSKILEFNGTANGKWPCGTLVSDGSYLYGLTERGGTNDFGTIFKIEPNGNGYSKLLDFVGVSNGNQPEGSLIFDGTFLYGMTGGGGTNGVGVIFKINPDGSGYSKLYDFSETLGGIYPQGSLISDGTFLYGMTAYGGINYMAGVIFKCTKEVGIHENPMMNNFNVFPNPVKNKIVITSNYNLQKDIVVSIFNIDGESVISNSYNNQNSIEMEVSSLPKGVYLIKIQSERGIVVKKLIIQ